MHGVAVLPDMDMTTKPIALLAALALSAACATSFAAETTATAQPLDWRFRIKAEDFKPVEGTAGEWIAPRVETPFPFDELIYDWNARMPLDEGFRLHFQVTFAKDDVSPWLYGGYWGEVKPMDTTGTREKPRFADGVVELDKLLLKRPARAFQFKVVSEGPRMLTAIPSVGVITTLNKPLPGPAAVASGQDSGGRTTTGSVILDLPFRLQRDIDDNKLPDRCQSAALATAMEYFGKPVILERIIAHTTDPEYKYFGIWPRTINAGVEFGFDGYIDRFRDWDSVRAAVAENKVLLCSIRMPAGGDYKAPPYASIGGHIVALNGITDDGRVVVTDSAVTTDSKGYLCQWLVEDFEKIWMEQKGGVAMVICPPPGAAMKTVENLPPFPHEERRQVMERARATAEAKAAAAKTAAGETTATAGAAPGGD